jgi:hypothetical protein
VEAIEVRKFYDASKHKGKRGVTMWYIMWVIALVGLGAFGVFRLRVRDQLNKRIKALRAQGYPMSLVEMDTWYRENFPDPEHNAWPVYVSAFEACVSDEGEDYENLGALCDQLHATRGQSLEPVQLQKARALVADNQACLDLLRGAGEIAHCRQTLDFLEGISMKLPWRHESRVCAMLLQLAIRVAVQDADTDQALKAIEVMLALANALDEPIHIINAQRMRILGACISTIEDVLSHQALTNEQVRALEARLEPVASLENFRQSLMADRCSVLAVFNEPARDVARCFVDSPKRLLPLYIVIRRLVGLQDQDVLSHINVMQAHFEAASLPHHEAIATIRTIEADPTHKLGMVARGFAPRYHRTYQVALRAVARASCARVGLAVERYRQAQGQVPDTLDSLVPTYMASLPLDPYDGQPLRFRHLDTGYVVYSVGVDLQDDGGKDRETRTSFEDKTCDETFIVAR